MSLTDQERALWAWQLDVPGFGEAGQERLRETRVLVSRVGGLGGPVAFALAAAGVGRIVLAHAGDLREDDLNRQLLMTHAGLGSPRADQAADTLRRFNPAIEVESVRENPSEENAADLVGRVDVVFGCAPLFEERFALNDAAMAQGKPYVDAAMYGMEGTVLLADGKESPCLRCMTPEVPPFWKRRFPVIGSLSSLVGQVAVLEWIKWTTGMPGGRAGSLLRIDGTSMRIDPITLQRRPECNACGGSRG